VIRVKKLVFVQSGTFHDGDVYVASPMGTLSYQIRAVLPTVYHWKVFPGGVTNCSVDRYEAAVAACQAHYESMVLSQIDVEPLAFTAQSESEDVKVWCATYCSVEYKIRQCGKMWDWQYHNYENDVALFLPAKSYEDAVEKCNKSWRQVVLSGVYSSLWTMEAYERDGVPKLFAEIRRLRDENERLESLMAEYDELPE
jgi:hypothetical protein